LAQVKVANGETLLKMDTSECWSQGHTFHTDMSESLGVGMGAYYTEFVIPGFPRVEEFYPFQEKHWFEKLHYRKVLRNRKLLLILLILVQRCQAETETQLVK
jgi:hypothetical protein